MKIYWSYRSILELQELPKKEAKAVFKECWMKAAKLSLRSRKFVYGSMLLAGVGALILDILSPYLPDWADQSWLCGGALGFTWSFFYTQHVFKVSLPFVREALDQRQATAN